MTVNTKGSDKYAYIFISTSCSINFHFKISIDDGLPIVEILCRTGLHKNRPHSKLNTFSKITSTKDLRDG